MGVGHLSEMADYMSATCLNDESRKVSTTFQGGFFGKLTDLFQRKLLWLAIVLRLGNFGRHKNSLAKPDCSVNKRPNNEKGMSELRSTCQSRF